LFHSLLNKGNRETIPNKDDNSPQKITIARARRIVMILYNGQHIQKYRSNAIVVMRRVE
jgi:hypothetical protein